MHEVMRAIRAAVSRAAGQLTAAPAGRQPAHSDDQVVSKEGNRVSPPSTNRVCPVM